MRPGASVQRVGYIFGLSGNPVLLRQAGPLAEDAALGRITGQSHSSVLV